MDICQLPRFSYFKKELSTYFCKGDNNLLVTWFMSGAKAMLTIIKKQEKANKNLKCQHKKIYKRVRVGDELLDFCADCNKDVTELKLKRR